jgi:hypothetical protein
LEFKVCLYGDRCHKKTHRYAIIKVGEIKPKTAFSLSPIPAPPPPEKPSVDIPDLSYSPGPGEFAGFYGFFFPERCWDSRGVRLVAEENWGSTREVTVTDTDAKEVKKVTTDGGEEERKGAWTVLDVSCDLVVAQFSTPNTPPQLVR